MNIRFSPTWHHKGGKGNVSRKTVHIYAGKSYRKCEVGFIDGSKWPGEPWEFEIDTNMCHLLMEHIHTMAEAKRRAIEIFRRIDS